MLLISDNSATDIMLRTAGGNGPVNARLRTLEVSGISVDRPTVQLIADAIGVKNLPPESELTHNRSTRSRAPCRATPRRRRPEAFYRDRRDTSTPDGMAKLLETIWRGRALSKANTDLLLDIMRRCETGPNRIKGMLPPELVVRHKTGTLGIGVANDVGIIELPNGAGHLVLTVFVKESTRTGGGPGASDRADRASRVRLLRLQPALMAVVVVTSARDLVPSDPHRRNAPDVRDVGERIRVEHDQVRPLAWLDRPELAIELHAARRVAAWRRRVPDAA
jgi:hypothetical protein